MTLAETINLYEVWKTRFTNDLDVTVVDLEPVQTFDPKTGEWKRI